jgi:hypothetical protein
MAAPFSFAEATSDKAIVTFVPVWNGNSFQRASSAFVIW